MTIVSDALQTLDEARALLDDAGLCPFRVFARVRTWSGDRVGLGTAATVDTEITVADGRRPQVRVPRSRDVVSPGSPMQATTFEVGPLTPDYGTGGVPTSRFAPAGTKTTELLFVVVGPGLPATGLLCKKSKEDLSSAFRYVITLESMGQAA